MNKILIEYFLIANLFIRKKSNQDILSFEIDTIEMNIQLE